MTQTELIRELIEKLLAEKEKSIILQTRLEEYKKGKDQNVSYIVGVGKFVTEFLHFYFGA